jgi:hypothetical protein
MGWMCVQTPFPANGQPGGAEDVPGNGTDEDDGQQDSQGGD